MLALFLASILCICAHNLDTLVLPLEISDHEFWNRKLVQMKDDHRLNPCTFVWVRCYRRLKLTDQFSRL